MARRIAAALNLVRNLSIDQIEQSAPIPAPAIDRSAPTQPSDDNALTRGLTLLSQIAVKTQPAQVAAD